MMRGLIKSTRYWQTQSAKYDWCALCEFAEQNGLLDKALELAPQINWGATRIDRQIEKLQAVLRDAGLEFVLPSARHN